MPSRARPKSARSEILSRSFTRFAKTTIPALGCKELVPIPAHEHRGLKSDTRICMAEALFSILPQLATLEAIMKPEIALSDRKSELPLTSEYRFCEQPCF
jgi:hypothetical protein